MFDLEMSEGLMLAVHPVIASGTLMPEEEAALSDRAAVRRRADFTAGRMAARQALEGLGLSPSPVTRGTAGEPVWPAGVVGSITHAADWALALVARSASSGGVGIDLESSSRFFSDLVDEIAFDDERDRLYEFGGDRLRHAAVELFAIKEAIYKAFYPRVREFFGFGAVRVVPTVSGHEAVFTSTLDAAYPPDRPFSVHTRWFDERVVAWLALPPD